jgi:hypothetical protein
VQFLEGKAKVALAWNDVDVAYWREPAGFAAQVHGPGAPICGIQLDQEGTMAGVAEVLVCLVIGISDGDTLTARCETPSGAQN